MGSHIYTHGKAQIPCDNFSFWLTSSFEFGFVYILPYLLLIAQLMLQNRQPYPWTQALIPVVVIRHRQLRLVYLEKAENYWQAVRSPPVTWASSFVVTRLWCSEIPVVRVTVLFWCSQQVFLYWRVWVRCSLHRHTLWCMTGADTGCWELNFQGHNPIEWGRISDLHLQEDDESKSIGASRLQLFGVMIWRLKRKDKYEGHFRWVCAHVCIYECTYWAASSLLYLNTAVKRKIFLIHQAKPCAQSLHVFLIWLCF